LPDERSGIFSPDGLDSILADLPVGRLDATSIKPAAKIDQIACPQIELDRYRLLDVRCGPIATKSGSAAKSRDVPTRKLPALIR
jgi:hypothetical protein